jgi:hypothetical protein
MLKSRPEITSKERGGVAEWFKAVVLKTSVAHSVTVGSNPTPSAGWSIEYWGGARVVEWGRLLSGYMGVTPCRRFESCPPRNTRKSLSERIRRAFLLRNDVRIPSWYRMKLESLGGNSIVSQFIQNLPSMISCYRVTSPPLYLYVCPKSSGGLMTRRTKKCRESVKRSSPVEPHRRCKANWRP